MAKWTMRPVGFVRGPSPAPLGRGAKYEEDAVLEILPEFAAGLGDIEGFSHLYVLWVFDCGEKYGLAGMPPHDSWPCGVFASRSPRRPNPIGLTLVRLLGREGNRLHVQGTDMVEGTPILDIKPYLSSVREFVFPGQKASLPIEERREERAGGREA